MALSNINLVTICVNAFHVHTETYQESPDPSFPVRDTESDLCWGWLGLACETMLLPLFPGLPTIHHLQYAKHKGEAWVHCLVHAFFALYNKWQLFHFTNIQSSK